MTDTLSPGAWENIKAMRAIAARDDQPDMVAVELVQEIAEIVERAIGRIAEDDCAMLLGIGSLLMKQAEAEVRAKIDAMIFMHKAMKQ